MQQPEVLTRLRESASNVTRPAFSGFGTVAEEMKSEVSSVWSNADERDDLIRTVLICFGTLLVVGVLAAVTSFLPLWLRLVVVFATIGILGRWIFCKIADTTD